MQNRRIAGFTLIELLTVIAVMAILGAILLPALGSARLRASSTVSASNLRQVYASIQMYANDHKGSLPGPVFSGQGPRFNPEVKSNLAAMLEPYLDSEYKSETYGYSKIFAYPEWEANAPDLSGPSYQVLRSPLKDKSLRPLGQSHSDPKKEAGPMTVMQLAAHELAGRRWIYEIDKQFPGLGNPGWAAQIPDGPVHGDHRNVLMLDGGVVALGLDEIVN